MIDLNNRLSVPNRVCHQTALISVVPKIGFAPMSSVLQTDAKLPQLFWMEPHSRFALDSSGWKPDIILIY